MRSLLMLAFPSVALAAPVAQGLDSEPHGEIETPEQVMELFAEAAASARIINGESATAEDWPMTGGLIADIRGRVFGQELETRALMCSSTLIAPDTVLLAAHCVDFESMIAQFDPTGSLLQIEEVSYYWSREDDLSQYQLGGPLEDLPADAVKAWTDVRHSDWDFAGLDIGLALNYDIALLFLEEAVTDVPFAYLPTPDEVDLKLDDDVVVVGWGQQVHVGTFQSPPPGSVGVKMMGVSHISEIADYEFKVGEVESDVRKCHGDSGGPTFQEIDTTSTETWRLIGVTSHAYDRTDCAETGGVDTRVDYYLDWIDGEMKAACASGQRVWCETDGIVAPPDENGLHSWEQDDTNPVDDGDGVVDGGDDLEEKAGGCGCSTGGAAGGFWILAGLVGLLARRRR